MTNIYGLKPGQKSKRWSHKAYSGAFKKTLNRWKSGDEGFLIREFSAFNKNTELKYENFLKQVAYSLEKKEYQVRQKLKELNAKGLIPKRGH